jgi:ketosteroid isomerase-like protein
LWQRPTGAGDTVDTPIEAQVLAANAAFYDAFVRRDIDAMEKLWAQRAAVSCIHPGWEVLRGRAAVMTSFHSILGAENSPPIRCARPTLHFLGEDVGLVFCDELLPGGRLIATNIFTREDGSWRMVHHQASQTYTETSPPGPGELN